MRLTPVALAAVIALGGATAGLAPPTRALAASFDCRKAASQTELTICANMGLNDRDVQMAQLYGIVRKLVPMGTRQAIIDRQAVWLKERNRCGPDRKCIGRSYDRRLRELNKVLEQRVYPQGPF
jgi:uncharacterized protein